MNNTKKIHFSQLFEKTEKNIKLEKSYEFEVNLIIYKIKNLIHTSAGPL